MKKFIYVVLTTLFMILLTGCGGGGGGGNIPKAPSLKFISDSQATVNENQISAIILQAKDSQNRPIAYSIKDGDSGSFNINSSTGVVTFKTAPDFESKKVYTFTAVASSGADTATQDVTINIKDVVEPFITVWKTDAPNQFIYIPIDTNESYNYKVDWGDGTDGEYTGEASHQYTDIGIYTIKISGNFPAMYLSTYSLPSKYRDNAKRLISVNSWGDIKWQSMKNMFNGAINLELNTTNSPILNDVTNMSGMFWGAEKFNQDISDWNVSNITDMSKMFIAAKEFNQDISNWDVSSVTNMKDMFHNARKFNQDLSSRDVSSVKNMSGMFCCSSDFNSSLNWGNKTAKVTDMSVMFYNTKSFNQDISSWNVSSVKNMKYMFALTAEFNSPLNWGNKTANVTDMSNMFDGSKKFDQNIFDWDVSSVTAMDYMFRNALSFKNHDLSSWHPATGVTHQDFFTGSGGGNIEPTWQ